MARGARKLVIAACAAVFAAALATGSAHARDGSGDHDDAWNDAPLSLDPINGLSPSTPAAALPRVLSSADQAAYRDIFRLQDSGDWARADRAIRKLSSRLLLGEVLAQRYLHRGYRAKQPELLAWMEEFADHADAEAIHALALQRGKSAGLPAPVAGYLFGGATSDGSRWEAASGSARLSAEDRHLAEAIKAKVRQHLADADTDQAREVLESADAKRLLNAAEADQLESLIGYAYFVDGRDDLVLETVGRRVAAGSKSPLAHWTAGLAAWRQDRMDDARRHFETLAKSPKSSSWMRAAGAYWAARTNLKSRRPEAVNAWLQVAAENPRTFYGLLARRALGLEIRFDWDAARLTRGDVALMQETPVGRRALGLIQVGEAERAERQLRQIYPNASGDEARALVALAQKANMPALAISLAGGPGKANENDAANYPVPNWNPHGGWRIDRALVLAFVRQESGFNPGAKSPAGAVGLMQLLPSTASFISRAAGKGPTVRNALYRPETNLMLGQRYLEHLLEDESINGNLLMMVASYNWGPGNVSRWMKKVDVKDDPLLFLESIPAPETRGFVERVLTNFWMYRMRMNQPTPSLDALASGDWPLYVQLDDHGRMVAENVTYR